MWEEQERAHTTGKPTVRVRVRVRFRVRLRLRKWVNQRVNSGEPCWP